MDINLLVINVGNTRLAAGAFVEGTLEGVCRALLADPGADERAISDAWGKLTDPGSAEVAVAGVNPSQADRITEIVQRTTGRKANWVGREIDIPIPVLTNHPQQTGIDRVLNVAAAYEQMGKAVAVVDAGTAVTVSFCDDQGRFVGGAIAPGVRLMLDSMHSGTAQLPQTEFAVPKGAYGRDTAGAMRQGVYHAIRGLVRETVEAFALELGNWPDVVATGGDAKALFSDWELIHAVSPDLTLYGIALAYAEHHIRHNT